MGAERRNPSSYFMARTIEVDAEGYRAAQIVWKLGSFQYRLIVMSARASGCEIRNTLESQRFSLRTECNYLPP